LIPKRDQPEAAPAGVRDLPIVSMTKRLSTQRTRHSWPARCHRLRRPSHPRVAGRACSTRPQQPLPENTHTRSHVSIGRANYRSSAQPIEMVGKPGATYRSQGPTTDHRHTRNALTGGDSSVNMVAPRRGSSSHSGSAAGGCWRAWTSTSGTSATSSRRSCARRKPVL